ncbi:M4 family metallopeptidase [Shewanella marina]|uniref:M4 family metallopeptidase n=1 Tax=Shewanella marina TaxID=487319 RepID=UPI00046F038A|nr:M4 family metallopeptidase [Shewanella marina]
MKYRMSVWMTAIVLMPTMALAAQSSKISMANQADIVAQLELSSSYTSTSVHSTDATYPQYRLVPLNGSTPQALSTASPQQNSNRRHQKYQQYFGHLPIWAQQVAVHSKDNDQVYAINGQLAQDLEQDISAQALALHDSATISPAIEQAINQYITTKYPQFSSDHIEVSKQTYIYVTEANKARITIYYQARLEDKTGGIALPYLLIDAETGVIYRHWNNVQHVEATGPGGNAKTGIYEYGEDVTSLQVTQEGDTCILENEHVKTVDLAHGSSNHQSFSFDCHRNTHKQINGAYSPLNDAHAFGNAVFDMYQEWYGMAPLDFQLLMRVHYSNHYENAFWDGSSMTFGDGHDDFYPLVSLDVVSHEVSHGFTMQHSQLIYQGQSGGINEAFSDMAGEAAESFLLGQNDWYVGADITKRTTALRYFEDPTRDNRSIKHADQYRVGMDVHYSSGVFNRAFYLLANSPNWDVRKAFHVMLYANVNYWLNSTDYIDGACGAINAASDLGLSPFDVHSAFTQVGVVCTGLDHIDQDQDGMSDFWEIGVGLDPNSDDSALDGDQDGLTNLQEFNYQTHPFHSDTDHDALSDGDEVNIYATEPLIADSDGDLINDGWEVRYGFNPLFSGDANNDFDGDGFSNLIEFQLSTIPTDHLSRPELITNKHFGFENQQLPHLWATSSQFDTGWLTNNQQAHQGQYSLGSRSIDDDQTAEIHWLGLFEEGYLYFNYYLDSESYGDYLELYIDGELVKKLDTQQQWQHVNHHLDAGVHSISWRYRKDSSVTSGADAAWIDDISFGRFDGDGDSDGIADLWEINHGMDPFNANDASEDWDGDFVSNLDESILGTDIYLADSDNDGMPDGWEVSHQLNPLVVDYLQDSDGDGYHHLAEFYANSDPQDKSSTPQAVADFKHSFETAQLPDLWRLLSNTIAANNWHLSQQNAPDGQQLIKVNGEQLFPLNLALGGIFKRSYLVFDYQIIAADACCTVAAVKVDNHNHELKQNQGWQTKAISLDAGSHLIEWWFKGLDNSDQILLDNVLLVSANSTVDHDNDQMPDFWELSYGLNISDASDALQDLDNDGLTNLAEYQQSTEPNNRDSDFDQIDDGWEVEFGLDPLDYDDAELDSDNDGYSNLQEFMAGTNPVDATSSPIALFDLYQSFETPELPSGWLLVGHGEHQWQVNRDSASDGQQSLAINSETMGAQGVGIKGLMPVGYIVFDYLLPEDASCCSANIVINGEAQPLTHDSQWQTKVIFHHGGADFVRWTYESSNQQGLMHLDNIHIVARDSARDHDNDGIPDIWEVENNLNLSDSSDASQDPDNDGLDNLGEYLAATYPFYADSDGDQLPDGWEVQYGLDPKDQHDALLDADSDGYSNHLEFIAQSDPTSMNSVPQFISEMAQSFEQAEIPQGWYIPEAADAGWRIDDSQASDGIYSLGADMITDSERAVIQWQAHFSDSFLLMDIKTASEACCDRFDLLIDNQLVFSAGGEQDWQNALVNIDAGVHTMSLVYRKDFSASQGQDTVWIDNLRFGIRQLKDSDSDGIPDEWEILNGLDQWDASDAALDNDNDGLSNLLEYQIGSNINAIDSDNDGVIDNEDSAPMDDDIGQHQAPQFHLDDILYIEATGPLTALTLPQVMVSDNGWLPPQVTHDQAAQLEIGQYQVTWVATDGEGNSASAQQQVIIRDTTAPEFDLVDVVQIDAAGFYTNVSEHLNVIAFDLVDGEVSVTLQGPQKYSSGAHQVSVMAADTAGNQATYLVNVEILPQLSIVEQSFAEPGEYAQVAILLSGKAAQYPVVVDYQVHGLSQLVTGSVQINEGQSGAIWFVVDDGANASTEVTAELVYSTNSGLSEQRQAKVNIIDYNLAPDLGIELQQNQQTVSVVSATAGEVTLVTHIDDINASDLHQVSYQLSEQLQQAQVSTISDGFIIDPSQLTAGTYQITVQVSEINTHEKHTVNYVSQLVVVNDTPQLGNQDSDGDGVDDLLEGLADTDSDGIADYLDNDSHHARLPISDGDSPLQTLSHQKLRLGWLNLQTNGLSAATADLSLETIAKLLPYQPAGGGASLLTTSTNNTMVVDAQITQVTPVIDIVLVNQTTSTQAMLLMPAMSEKVLTENNILAIYTDEHQWQALQVDGDNHIASAQSDINGNCPYMMSDNYQAGLNSGDNCILLTLADGGIYDNDNERNGHVSFTGVVVTERANTLPEIVIQMVTQANEATKIIIDASASIDFDGDRLRYHWTLPDALVATEIATGKLEVQLPNVDSHTQFTIELMVSDGIAEVSQQVQVQVNNVVSETAVPAQESSGGSLSILSLLVLFIIRARYYQK